MPEPTETVLIVPVPEVALAADPAAAKVPERWFLRFTLAQRYLHAVLFTTFLVLAATGLMMRFSGSIWA
ncbi:MAG: hypothetical protein WB974_06355, partial [Acidobacteriaceae bacterium]